MEKKVNAIYEVNDEVCMACVIYTGIPGAKYLFVESINKKKEGSSETVFADARRFDKYSKALDVFCEWEYDIKQHSEAKQLQ